jgi:hypothetical protein
MPATARAPLTYTIPKRGGGLRLMARLAPPDARLWEGLAREAGPRVEDALGDEVLANRGPFRPALRRARGLAEDLARRSEAILHTDVAAFYPSIDPSVLAGSLGGCGVEPRTARLAGSLSEAWSGHGVPGLPVGPAASAVLANLVLAPVDAALRAREIPFLRWVDDYLIGVAGDGPGAALEAIDGALARLGLRRHVAKTRLDESGTASRWLGEASVSRC